MTTTSSIIIARAAGNQPDRFSFSLLSPVPSVLATFAFTDDQLVRGRRSWLLESMAIVADWPAEPHFFVQ